MREANSDEAIRHKIMSIFNSLGSNYSLDSILQALFASNSEENKTILASFLEEKYGGKAILFYKGREAIRFALRLIDKKEAVVGICGFTCYAVYDAVVKEGYQSVFFDIDEQSLHFSKATLEAAKKKNPQLQIVIIQNTLGYPCDMEAIAKYCKKEKIILIEDLAHSIGTTYENGKEAGTVGDFVALSFSQDKVIDGVSGGALIIRNNKFSILNFTFSMVATKQQVIDKLYPLFTFLIRKTYGFGLGKFLHRILKLFHLLSQPMMDLDGLHELPGWYCFLVYSEFLLLESSLSHRRKIASIYKDMLGLSLRAKRSNPSEIATLSSIARDDNIIELSTNLRFPIFVEKREELIAFLKQQSIFVSDIWYDAPIAPKKYLSKTSYRHECPNGEKVSERILNLPTHRNVSEEDAKFIADKVNEWIGKGN